MTNILIIYGKKKTINNLKKTNYLKKNFFRNKNSYKKTKRLFRKKLYV